MKKDIFKKAKDAIFDYGVNEIPNIKESRMAYKAFGKDPSRYRVSSLLLPYIADIPLEQQAKVPSYSDLSQDISNGSSPYLRSFYLSLISHTEQRQYARTGMASDHSSDIVDQYVLNSHFFTH